MIPFGLCHLRKQVLQLGVAGTFGMFGVLVDAELFLILHILKKISFFLGQL